MENSESHIDLKVLGAEMRELRHQRGMSIVRFAYELDKPAWLIDLIEHVDEAPASGLCDLLPKQESASVQEAFKRLRSRTCFSGTGEQRHGTASTEEHTFYLPVTVSIDGLMNIMDQMMLFAVDADGYDARRQRLLCQGVVSVSMLASLLHMQYARAGKQRKARYCLHSFREGLQERMRICC